MSSESEVNLDIFREKAAQILEIAFLSLVLLIVIGIGFYLAVLKTNVQNSLPLLLLIFLGAFTWVTRAKIMEIDAQQIRIYLIQWISLSILIIIISVIITIFYPYSQIVS